MRRYPPLAVIAVAVTLAMFTLPSALNLPTANPTQTLEYAPVPGSSSAGQEGNFAGLGLATSQLSTLNGAGVGLPSAQPGLLQGVAAHPSDKQCVGNPPRQTEDPLSPPCVAFFDGYNGGATYQGVTREEVKVLFYLEGGYHYAGGSDRSGLTDSVPAGQYFDLARSSSGSEFIQVRALRLWQAYFNNRYQTYKRFVHFYVYFNSGTDTEEQRRADAAANFQLIKPFAVFTYPIGFAGAYAQAMAQHGVLSFGGSELRLASFYKANPGLIWGFSPTVEAEAAMFSSYLCIKVAPYKVSFSGNPGENGQARKYGLVYTTDPGAPEVTRLAMLIKAQVEACGITITDTATSPTYAQVPGSPGNAETSMATFKTDGITTVIWGGGWEIHFSHAAANLGYDPEWVVADDTYFNTTEAGSIEDQSAWQYATLVTPAQRMGPGGIQPACVDAVASVDTAVTPAERRAYCYASNSAYDDFWDDIRQLFTGIQVSGPRLRPDRIDQGFRAIPPYASTSPFLPSCYYEPGGNTCVHDAVAARWDPAGANDSGWTGCWRLAEAGKRYRRDEWPLGNATKQQLTGDPCNTR